MLPHCLSDTLRVIIAGQASGTLGVSTFTGPLSNLLLAALAGALLVNPAEPSFLFWQMNQTCIRYSDWTQMMQERPSTHALGSKPL